MAKVTDLNGCFVRVENEDEQRKIEIAVTKMSCTYRMTLTINDFDIYSRISFRTDGACKVIEPKEIYFHDGEFFDCPVEVKYSHSGDGIIRPSDESNAKLAQIPWTDGSIDEQEAIDWANGDHCVWSGTKAAFIGYSKSHGSRCAIEFLRGNCSVIETVFIEDISKPETETEKKARELAEEVNRICFDLFGTPAFDCNQYIIDTVEKFIVNGYKKVD